MRAHHQQGHVFLFIQVVADGSSAALSFLLRMNRTSPWQRSSVSARTLPTYKEKSTGHLRGVLLDVPALRFNTRSPPRSFVVPFAILPRRLSWRVLLYNKDFQKTTGDLPEIDQIRSLRFLIAPPCWLASINSLINSLRKWEASLRK